MPSVVRSLCLALPTAITLSALGCGLSSILCAMDGDFVKAYWCLFGSAILDGLDGHVARALKATSAIGAELDSLCDLVDFGVSPAFVLLLWARRTNPTPTAWYDSGGALWACFLVYVSGCAYRLARFNLDDKAPVPPPPHTATIKAWHSEGDLHELGTNSLPTEPMRTWLDQYVNRAKFFQGIPAPAAAMVSLTPVVMWLESLATGHPVLPALPAVAPRAVVPAVYLLVATLMVGRFRTFSSKMLIKGPVLPTDPSTSHLRSRNYATAVLKAIGAAGFLFVYSRWPYKVHIGATAMYFLSLPVSHFVYSFLLTEPKKKE